MIYRLAAQLESLWIKWFFHANRYPPLFIVGAPRSGTTIIYQHILNHRRFAYLSNLAKTYPQAPVFTSLWVRLLHRQRPSTVSRYGIIDGAGSPSDGWEIFHRWFPERDLGQEIKMDRLLELRGIVRGLEIMYHAPFINKNNSNSIRIKELAGLFPQSLFVHVSRELVDNVRSLLQARREHGTTLNTWWGTCPPRFWRRPFLEETEQVVFQICDIELDIGTELQRLPPERWIKMPYESFCQQPGKILAWVDDAYDRNSIALRRNSPPATAAIRCSQQPTPEDELRQAVDANVRSWRKELSNG
jgi:hypothetical protein